MKQRPVRYHLAALLALALVVAACGEGPGADTADEGDEGEAGEAPAERAEVVDAIDDIAAQVEAGELEYDPGSDSDETIEALQDAIPEAPDGYPSRSVELIIGFGEGGGSDNYARFAGHDAARIMGQEIVYNNIPGASGEVGLGQMFTQAADGYVLSTVITNQVINDALNTQPYDFIDDVALIIRQQGPTEVYWVAEDSEWETFEDMLEEAADNPDQVTVTGSGIGSDDEFRLLELGDALDTSFGYVPFDSVGDRVSGLLSGDIDVMHETGGTVYDLYEDGQIRPLAYGGDIVFDAIDPDIPSVADLGYEVPIGRWRGIVGLPDTDPEILEYVHNVFYAAAQLPHYTEYEAEFFQDVAGGYLNPEEWEEEALAEREAIETLAEEFDYDTEELEEDADE